MDLKDFISTALTDIAEGASKADKSLCKMGGEVNPKAVSFNGGAPCWEACEVRFSVTVTAAESSSGRRGLGVVFGSVGIGTSGSSGCSSGSEARLEFSIRLALPPSQLHRGGKPGQH